MKYKLINYRPNHKEMINMINKKLFTIIDNEVVSIKIIGIEPDKDTKKWVWKFADETGFKKEQPIFKNRWSGNHYLQRSKKNESI